MRSRADAAGGVARFDACDQQLVRSISERWHRREVMIPAGEDVRELVAFRQKGRDDQRDV